MEIAGRILSSNLCTNFNYFKKFKDIEIKSMTGVKPILFIILYKEVRMESEVK